MTSFRIRWIDRIPSIGHQSFATPQFYNHFYPSISRMQRQMVMRVNLKDHRSKA